MCVPDGISTDGISATVIDYLLPSPGRFSHAPITPQDASRSRPAPRATPDTGALTCGNVRAKKDQKISGSVRRGGEELIHNPDTRLKSGQRDALVGAMEHGVVVVAFGQHQR